MYLAVRSSKRLCASTHSNKSVERRRSIGAGLGGGARNALAGEGETGLGNEMSSIVGDETGELVRNVRGQQEVRIGDMAAEVGEDVG